MGREDTRQGRLGSDWVFIELGEATDLGFGVHVEIFVSRGTAYDTRSNLHGCDVHFGKAPCITVSKG